MSLTSLIGQHIFIGISGHSLTKEEKDFIIDYNIGGICLFGRNVSSPEQVSELCAEIQALRDLQEDQAPLFIGIDMEGGRVHRLKSPFTIWPAAKKLGDLDSISTSYQFANYMGQELSSVGINLDFAPCVDVFTNPANTVIGDRAISSDPEKVAGHASALVRGYTKANIITCAKHFPGHGNTLVDSHLDLPIENLEFGELENCELIPFKKLIRTKVDMIMTSHIKFPKIDPEWPVTLSEIFIKDIVRKDLGFQGLIITDDLGMKAMANYFGAEEIPVRALQAGAELLLYCNEPETPLIAIESLVAAHAQGTLDKSILQANHRKILDFKKQKLINPDPLPIQDIMQIVGREEHQKLANAIREGKLP